jgi:PAS domain S-box-containing protein
LKPKSWRRVFASLSTRRITEPIKNNVTEQTDILDLVHESVITRNDNGLILSWNAASEMLYGWPAGEAIGRDIDQFLSTEHANLSGLSESLFANDRWEGEFSRKTKANEERVLDVRLIVERDSNGATLRIIETARDITRRKTAEAALKISEYRYRNMFDAMAVAFWEVDFAKVGAMLIPLRDQGVTDLRGYLLANRDFVRETMQVAMVLDLNLNGLLLFGATERDDIVGQAVSEFWPPSSEPVYIDALVATMTRQPHIVTETRLNRIDGKPVDVLFTVSLSEDNRKRGVMLIGVVDISARKEAEAELREVRAEFARAARVSMLGELTTSIAHEVSQPLAAIATSGAASLRWLAAETPNVEEVRNLSERIVNDARRAAAIIARIRAMAERREPERTLLSLNTLVEEVVTFLAHELQAKAVTPELQLDDHLPLLLVDRTQMQQVVVNLAVNAMQAMSSCEERLLVITTALLADGRVSLALEDSGPGLPDDPGKLFDGFYTTKATGMGMGLPICRSIIEAHGGNITAQNSDSGARFTVTLLAPIIP